MESILKWYLALFLLLYLAATFIYPTVKVYRRTGINPVTFTNEDTAHDYIGLVMKIMIAALVAVTLVYSISDRAYNYLLPVWYLEHSWLKVAGLIVMHTSLLWIIIAQRQMDNSWRIGIDEANKTTLVTHGVFSVSRNPVFLGMIITVLGLFFVIPNAITLLLFIMTYIVIQIQIRLEELFLETKHGTEYIAYKSKTKRLI